MLCTIVMWYSYLKKLTVTLNSENVEKYKNIEKYRKSVLETSAHASKYYSMGTYDMCAEKCDPRNKEKHIEQRREHL